MPDIPIAFLFPGQGAQQVGMLGAAYERFAAVRDTFSEASQAVGYDMWSLVQGGPQEALNLTETTQPVLLTCSVALWRAWAEESGTFPSIMAGHSLGEFSALVCAGVLDFNDAVRLVRKRGEYMQTAVPVGQGAMAAIIGLDDNAIVSICDEVARGGEGVVAAVNFNAPGQVVIAGDTSAVELATAKLKESGAKRAMPLPVSAPFHTSLIKPAGERLAQAMADIAFSVPRVPVVLNVDAELHSDPEQIRHLLVEQIYSPVKWTSCIKAIIDSGANHLVECGPGKVLSGLNRRIDKSLKCCSLEEPEALLDAVATLK